MSSTQHPAAAVSAAVPEIAASIVICTHRRPELLGACLDSLLGQRAGGGSPALAGETPGAHEILVIDNSPLAEGRPVVESRQVAFALRGVPLRYILEERPGVGFARNRGVVEAAGALIAFIDDDERACGGWLELLLEPFHRLGDAVDIVAGEVEPDFGTLSRPDWLADDMMHLFSCRWGWDSEARFLRETEWFGEGNCAFRKRLMAARSFPTDLGRKGDGLLANEGMVFMEMRSAGAATYYVPAATVSHLIHPDRLNRRWLMRRMFYQGVSNRLMQRHYGVKEQRWDFNVNLAKLADIDVETLDGESLRALIRLYYQLGYASAHAMN
ncbi:glycosyltransferase family 2 protein (plasmid) [Azospirillum humicireducens]|uniref:Glycosyltransferase family 2 protein n=1 Tax=Azospirillum humicireducens TaxID=1226968 RepID=A0A2R4VUI7_9PROT|nr:glycosyltransferase family A protein [Azospirillum humicireducens]AWB08092.1 glycosyltransferase family 2 protein [Azospirillum humicireducens]